MKCAILQPSYLPWMGVLALINEVDIYVFYDDVPFEAQSWQQRNRVKTQDGVKWLTVPVVKNFGQLIKDVEINYATDWRKKHFNTISQAYAKAPFYKNIESFLVEFYGCRFIYLSDMNIYLTKRLADGMEVKIPTFLKSSDFKLEGEKTDRLINLLKQLGATEFFEGPVGKSYIEEDKFKKEGIKLTWWDYKPKDYPQLHGQFVGYLSVLDLFMNVGGNLAYL